MGIGRSDALDRMGAWRLQVEKHMAKILASPGDLSVPHYLHEVRIWMRDIERLKQHVGKRTGAEWDQVLEKWRNELLEAQGE